VERIEHGGNAVGLSGERVVRLLGAGGSPDAQWLDDDRAVARVDQQRDELRKPNAEPNSPGMSTTGSPRPEVSTESDSAGATGTMKPRDTDALSVINRTTSNHTR